LKDNNGRSVIKVTHEPLPAAFFEASDSEDEDDSDIEGDLPSDEFELDSEEGFRKVVKDAAEAAKNGDIPAEDDEDEDFEDDEDEDDEDEDDEDMDSEDDDELLETTVLAALTAGKVRGNIAAVVDNELTSRSSRPTSTSPSPRVTLSCSRSPVTSEQPFSLNTSPS
jgi:hypothetical protein